MNIRKPYAHQFYRGSIGEQMSSFLEDCEVNNPEKPVTSGIVPHAGWFFSGRVAARVFQYIKETSQPDTVVIFGAVHSLFSVGGNALSAEGEWEISDGSIRIDSELAETIIDESGGLITDEPGAHDYEHSIEVQLPMIKYLMPNAEFVPLAVLPDENAAKTGQIVANAAKKLDKSIVAVGSTDLTHYGENYGFAPKGSGPEAKQWMEENDRSIIDKILNFELDEIVNESRRNRNACGSGAITASAAFAMESGAADAELIDYVTSFDILPDREFTMAVGYAGIVFR